MAGALAAVSVGLAAGRRYALGPDLDGGRAPRSWKATLVATGELGAQDAAVGVSLVPDFRNQHVTDEHFASKDLVVPRPGRDKDAKSRSEATFRRALKGGALPFRLDYTFHVQTSVRQPTPAMQSQTEELDAPPNGSTSLQSSPHIESEDPLVSRQANDLFQKALMDSSADGVDFVQLIFDYVSKLPTDPSFDLPISARDCLAAGRGDSGGKARLLVALCRNRGIPARLVSGLILAAGQDQSLHQWAEVWVNQRWLPMCPTRHHFGPLRMSGYLVLHIGDDDLVRCRGRHQVGFVVHAPRQATARDEEGSVAGEFWHLFSLTDLRRGERNVVKFLLLLPLAALIVSFVRTVIGVPTFGTFSPALLGLAFLDLKTLHWGIGIFVLIVLVGWGMRRFLEGFHLLQVPRTSALLTLIVLLLIAVIVKASNEQIAATQYIQLFPLVILTHLVERFWTVEAEDGTASSFRTLLGTMAIAALVSVSLAPEVVSRWMFRYPETLGVVLAAQFVLGRYTGYRLTELYRFGDLLEEHEQGRRPPSSASNHEAPATAAAVSAAAQPAEGKP